jgi:hypothetical protein
VEWRYSKGRIGRERIERLARASLEEVRKVIDCCTNDAPTAFIPSDFPQAGVTQDELNNLINQLSKMD